MSLIETAVPPTPDVSVLMAAPGKASAATDCLTITFQLADAKA